MNVVIYGADYCTYCLRAKKVSERLGLEYKFVEVDGPMDDLIQSKFPGVKTIPQIEVDGNHVGGFDDFNKVVQDQ